MHDVGCASIVGAAITAMDDTICGGAADGSGEILLDGEVVADETSGVCGDGGAPDHTTKNGTECAAARR